MTPAPVRIPVPALALISSVGAFGTHLLLPALPAIRDEFGVTSGQVQLVVSLSLLALAAGALLNGPLSDRFGRRPVALVGLGLYILGSLLAWSAEPFVGVLAGRIVQAVGGGAVITVIRAVIRDVYDRDSAASIFGYMAAFVLLVPLLVPLLGGLVVEHLGWRSNFLVAIGVGITVAVFVWRRLPETRNPLAGEAATPGGVMFSLLRRRVFLGYALNYAFSMAALQAFIAGAPLLLIGNVGLSPSEYGAWYMLTAGASLMGFALAGRLSQRAGITRMLQTGLVISVTATLLLVAVQASIGVPVPLAFILPAMGHTFANALMAPSATSGAVGERPDQAGAAAGLLGFLQFLFAAGAAQLTGILQDHTELGVALVMAGASLGAAAAYLFLVRPATAGQAGAGQAQ